MIVEGFSTRIIYILSQRDVCQNCQCVSLTNLGLLINNKSMSPEYPMKQKVNNQGIKYDIT